MIEWPWYLLYAMVSILMSLHVLSGMINFVQGRVHTVSEGFIIGKSTSMPIATCIVKI